MNAVVKIIIVVTLALAAGGVIIMKYRPDSAPVVSTPAPAVGEAVVVVTEPLPRFVDLGSDKCQACKAMVPVIASLRTNFVGKLQVDFIDVWEQDQAAEEYGISIIPTQILFDAVGNELFRHEGFISQEDVIAKFKENGVEL